MGASQIIQEIIALDDQIAKLRSRLDDLPVAELQQTLGQQIGQALSGVGEDDPLPLTLVRLTDLACGLDEGAAAILAPGLSNANHDVRQLTGEALLSLADDGIDAIVPAVEHSLRAGGAAAEEMPFLLAMIDDAAAPRLIERFLAAGDPEIVAAAIEALADAGDRESLDKLRALASDKREVSIDGGQGEASVTLGELATEAIDAIAQDEED
jgi:hypothetical protein